MQIDRAREELNRSDLSYGAGSTQTTDRPGSASSLGGPAGKATPAYLVLVLSIIFASPATACIGERQASPQMIDRHVMLVRPAHEDAVKIEQLRQTILERNAQGDRKGALAAEAEAMTLLGYEFRQARGGGCGGWVRVK